GSSTSRSSRTSTTRTCRRTRWPRRSSGPRPCRTPRTRSTTTPRSGWSTAPSTWSPRGTGSCFPPGNERRGGRLEERPGARPGSEVRLSELGDDAAAGRPLQEAELQQVGLVDVLDRLGLLPERDRKRREPNRAAAEPLHDAAEELAVEPLESCAVHLEQGERLLRDGGRDRALVPHLGHVADAAEDPVRDPRRAARACGDELGGVVGDLDPEDARRPPHDRRELGRVVEVEPEGEAEAVAQRRRQEAGARRRADERERRQVEGQRAGGGPLPDDDVEAEVLERRVEDLLGGAAHPVDLVDEEHVAGLERREDRRDVLPLEPRPRHLADADGELVAHDLRERRLAEAGRAGEEDVVERLPARLRRLEGDRELLLDALLADEVAERARPQRPLQLVLGIRRHRRQELGHAACLSACRTCSATGSDGSTSASARSASTSDQPSSTSASRAVRPSSPAATSTSGSFSFSSSTTRCAVLSPMPGIAWNRFTSSRAIARRSSAGVEPETIASATFGPTPFTPSSSSKSSRSSAEANP